MQFFSLIWNCHTVVFCTSVTPCKLLRIADPQSDSSRFKGHGMLAPFTAGWQSNDLHPLIIERSEVATLSFSIIFVTSLEIQCSIAEKLIQNADCFIYLSYIYRMYYFAVQLTICICRVPMFTTLMGTSTWILLQDYGAQLQVCALDFVIMYHHLFLWLYQCFCICYFCIIYVHYVFRWQRASISQSSN